MFLLKGVERKVKERCCHVKEETGPPDINSTISFLKVPFLYCKVGIQAQMQSNSVNRKFRLTTKKFLGNRIHVLLETPTTRYSKKPLDRENPPLSEFDCSSNCTSSTQRPLEGYALWTKTTLRRGLPLLFVTAWGRRGAQPTTIPCI